MVCGERREDTRRVVCGERREHLHGGVSSTRKNTCRVVWSERERERNTRRVVWGEHEESTHRVVRRGCPRLDVSRTLARWCVEGVRTRVSREHSHDGVPGTPERDVSDGRTPVHGGVENTCRVVCGERRENTRTVVCRRRSSRCAPRTLARWCATGDLVERCGNRAGAATRCSRSGRHLPADGWW